MHDIYNEGSKVVDLQCWFSALSLTCRDSLNLLMILQILDGRISKFQLCIEKCSETVRQYVHIVFTTWWTSPHPCFWATEPFTDAPFIPNLDTITCYQWNCLRVERSKQVFFLSIPQLSQSCFCPCLNFDIKFGMSIYLEIGNEVHQFKH